MFIEAGMEMPYCFEVPMQLGQKRRSLPRSPLAGPVIESFHDNIKPDFPDDMQSFDPTGMLPQRPDLEILEPVAPTTANSDPQSPSSATIFDGTEEYNVMAIDDGNRNANSLHGRCLQRLKCVCRIRTRRDQDTQDRFGSIPNRRSSSIGTIYQIASCWGIKDSVRMLTAQDVGVESMRPFDQACQNCRQKYLVVHTLSQIAKDLLNQRRASHCRKGSVDGDIVNEDFVTGDGVGSSVEDDVPSDCVEGLHQMLQISRWTCGEIRDELKGLKLSMSCGGREKWKAKKKFVRRWGHQPHVEFCQVDFDYNQSGLFREMDVEEFLEGKVTSSPIETVLPLWTAIRDQWYGSASISQLPGAGPHSKPKAKLLWRIVNGSPEECHIQVQLAERCLGNLKTVEELLYDLLDGIDQNIDPGRACSHPRPCLQLKNHSLRLQKARIQVIDTIRDVLAFEGQAKGLYSGGMGVSDWDLVREWGSLHISCARKLIGATNEEQIQNILLWPPHENEFI